MGQPTSISFQAPAPRRAGRHDARSGFTLLELMVALTIGGLAISSIYAIGAAATRTFHQQHQVASAQTALRIALEQVKRDIARAGYLAIPNFQVAGFPSQTCLDTDGTGVHAPTGTGSLAAVSHYDNDWCSTTANGCGNIDATGANAANGFSADQLFLMGNYSTANEYPGVGVVDSQTISLGPTWHSYQTDFTTWYSGAPGVFDNIAFTRVFAPGRMIRIRTTSGKYHFALIRATTAPNDLATPPTNARIAFWPGVPPGCLDDVEGGWVAPVNAIRYFPQDEPATRAAANAATYGPMAQLMRQEVDPTTKAAGTGAGNSLVSPPARAVLDYLVAFQLSFVMNQNNAQGQVDFYAPGGPVNVPTDATVNANPERIRAVRITLAARTPEQDKTFPFSGCGGLRCYQVFTDRPGAARVRVMRAEVFVPNIAYEGY